MFTYSAKTYVTMWLKNNTEYLHYLNLVIIHSSFPHLQIIAFS